jgi:hypothetical protein
MSTRREPEDLGRIALTQRGRLDPVDSEDELVTASVGPAQEAIALWAALSAAKALRAYTVSRGLASFPNSRVDACRIRTLFPLPSTAGTPSRGTSGGPSTEYVL